MFVYVKISYMLSRVFCISDGRFTVLMLELFNLRCQFISFFKHTLPMRLISNQLFSIWIIF